MGKQEEADLAGRLTNVENSFRNALCSGTATATQIAMARRTWELMNDDWTTKKDTVMKIYGQPAALRLDGPERWEAGATEAARREVQYEAIEPLRYFRQGQECDAYRRSMVTQYSKFFDVVRNEFSGMEFLLEANALTPELMAGLMAAYLDWFTVRTVTPANLEESPQAVFWDFLHAQSGYRDLFYLVQSLQPHSTPVQGEVVVPVEIEVLEGLISLFPLIGNVVAGYEVATGHNLFGYQLSPLQRTIMAATVLLPIAGRLFRGGRALYSESRMVALYGRDASFWGKALQAGARSVEQREASRILQRAEELVRVQRQLDGKLAADALAAIPKLVHSPGIVVSYAEADVAVLFDKLAKQYPLFSKLDAAALQRVVGKADASQMQGILLEELAASHSIPWLRSRQGGFALGIKVPKNATLEFVPGHRLRSIGAKDGWDITDGVLGYYSEDKKVFNIAAIFEAKSGRTGPRELFEYKPDLRQLSQTQRDTVTALAKEEYVQRADQALRDGVPYNESLDDIAKQVSVPMTLSSPYPPHPSPVLRPLPSSV